MDEKKQSGFTLFPQPPTPPAPETRSRLKLALGASSKLTKSRPASGRSHGRKLSTIVTNEASPPALIPAPLKIRKASEEIPPLPTTLLSFPPSTPTRTREFVVIPNPPENGAPQLPTIRQSSPLSPLPETPVRQIKTKGRNVADLVELDVCSKKRASSRLSQWLDLEDGEIDQRRLSRYLGSVLDNRFEVPTFDPKARNSVALARRMSRLELIALMEQCECPPTAIICQCSSSPEFEKFRTWSQHKTNASVSSTACLVGVPRARFQPAFYTIPDSPVAEDASPPGLAYDTEEETNDGLDWSVPRTPSKHDIFTTPSSRQNKSYGHTAEPSSATWSWTPSKFQSFSRPFASPPSSQSMDITDSAPSTPSRSQSRSTAPKSGYLTSISTLSSFDFDFDFKARCRSLAQQQALEFQSTCKVSSEKEQNNHLRTDSNESFASEVSHSSQYELNTVTATVAVSSSSVKPVLVTNKAKRHKMPASTICGETTTWSSISTKTSTSSISIMEYYRQYNSGFRTHSKTNTGGSSQTDTSGATSAMLTGPMSSPTYMQSKKSPIPGNAFAQRSNTMSTMPSILADDDLSLFDFGAMMPVSDQYKARPDTATSTASNQASVKSRGPAQAYLDASARLKAYMDSCIDSASPIEYAGAVGLGLKKQESTQRKKKYLGVNEGLINRNDSGIFGHSSGVGALVIPMPGRREFSEPHFYRT